jgi:tannase/feruloyl esterase
MRRSAFGVFSAVLLGLAVAARQAEAAQSCESLTTLSLPNNTTVTSATSVPAGPFVRPGSTTPVNVPAFCRVAVVSKPSSDSLIKFEVWMPAAGWNGKLDHGGNGGYGGSLSTPAGFMVAGLLRGYATTGTDMGHDATVTPGASFGLQSRRAWTREGHGGFRAAVPGSRDGALLGGSGLEHVRHAQRPGAMGRGGHRAGQADRVPDYAALPQQRNDEGAAPRRLLAAAMPLAAVSALDGEGQRP